MCIIKLLFSKHLILLAIFLLASCATNAPRRVNASLQDFKPDRKPTDAIITKHDAFEKLKNGAWLFHVEFENSGAMHSKTKRDGTKGFQLDFLSKSIGSKKKELQRKGVLFVSFMHGWNHYSAHTDENLKKFKLLIARLAQKENLRSNPRQVVGVYLGWNGYVYKLDSNDQEPSWVKNSRLAGPLSYWRGKLRAHKIGEHELGVAHVMNNINQMKISIDKKSVAREIRNKGRLNLRETSVAEKNTIRSRYIHLGHSFGSTGTISAIIEEKGTEREAIMLDESKRNADFVLMMNPAFEGDIFDPYMEDFEKDSGKIKAPRVVVVSAHNDSANKYAFRAGQLLGSLNPENSKGRRSVLGHLTALGFYKKYHTHTLHRENGNIRLSTMDKSWIKKHPRNPKFATMFSAKDPAITLPAMSIQSIDSTIVNKHGGVWGLGEPDQDFVDFMYRFISRVDKQISKENKSMLTEKLR